MMRIISTFQAPSSSYNTNLPWKSKHPGTKRLDVATIADQERNIGLVRSGTHWQGQCAEFFAAQLHQLSLHVETACCKDNSGQHAAAKVMGFIQMFIMYFV